MTDRNIFDAIITLPSNNSVMLLESLSIINQYTNKIQLETNDKGKIWYSVNVDLLLEKDIDNESIEKLRNSGWTIDGNLLKNNM